MIRSKRFEGKVAIVTGSTQGIGYSIAHRLGLEGASVVVSSRNQENVDEATQKLKGQGIQVLGLVCHVSNAQHRKDLIHKTLEKFGKIDVIVSNAAVNPMAGKSIATIMGTQESILDKMWEVNIKAPILLMQEAAPHMKNGSIIFISSISAYVQPISWAMYGVTKTTLLGLTKALASELGPEVRVNCVASRVVPTRFGEIITKSDTVGHDYIFVRAFVPFVASLIVKAWKESDDRSDMKVRLGGMAPMNDEREWFKKEAFKWGVQLFHPLLPHKPNQEILQMKIILDSSKLKRLGTPEEIAAAAVFLASDDASYITGETLVVAGGIPSRL